MVGSLLLFVGCDDECAPEQTSCEETCVDLRVSREHCGACDIECAAGEVCSEGTCALSCGGTTPTVCDGGCADLMTSSNHCGACGNACENGEGCVDGACVTVCPGSQVACGDTCTYLSISSLHCGECGNACLDGHVCRRGECTSICPEGQLYCDNRCLDVQSNEAHCGACGNTCESAHHCLAGTCVPGCGSEELVVCEGSCVDPSDDSDHCGECGHECPSLYYCSRGVCVSSCVGDDRRECDGECVNVRNDNDNCGGCGVQCMGDRFCRDNNCEIDCGSGGGECGDECTDVMTDPRNCGFCGTTCGEEETCEEGSCVDAYATSFLLNIHDTSRTVSWLPWRSHMTRNVRTFPANDVDCNGGEGSTQYWWAERHDFHFGSYTSGMDTADHNTPYAPRHIVVFNNEVLVMDRDTHTVHRYNFDGTTAGTFVVPGMLGQGMATNGTDLYISVWNGSASSILQYSPTFALLSTHPNPSGLTGNNIFDLVWDPREENWLGLATTGASDNTTETDRIHRFEMRGSVLASYYPPGDFDGIGRACY